MGGFEVSKNALEERTETNELLWFLEKIRSNLDRAINGLEDTELASLAQ